MRFEPPPGDTFWIGKEIFEVLPHPAVPAIALAIAGRKSIIYLLRSSYNDQTYALQVFKAAFSGKHILETSERIAKYATMPGMSVCQHTVLTKSEYPSLIKRYPELEHAVLRPWVDGRTWYELILLKHELSLDEGLQLADSVVNVLAHLEARGVAHCDISGENVVIDTDRLSVNLVSVRSMYAPDLNPVSYPIGTPGYQHKTSRTNPEGQWLAEGDRFAGAVIIAEILGWHDHRIRDASHDEGHYFGFWDMQSTSSLRYGLMLKVLNNISPGIAELFENAWLSDTLADCPTLADWANVIAKKSSKGRQIVADKVSLVLNLPENLQIDRVQTKGQWSMGDRKEWESSSSKIRILFLAANPVDTRPLRLDAEMRAIDQALQRAEFRDKFDIKQHWAVRVSDLQELLLRHKPDIVHFSGHGSAASEIILEDSSGNSRPVSDRALSRLFSILKDNIKCVILNACYSEQQAQAIARSIDCVVGMSKAIGDEAAVEFASAFYQALGFGRNVRTAFELGCIQIDLEGLDEQDTPKLIAVNSNPKEIVFVNNR